MLILPLCPFRNYGEAFVIAPVHDQMSAHPKNGLRGQTQSLSKPAKYCAQEVLRISAQSVSQLDEFDHVESPLTAFDKRDVALISREPSAEFRLRKARRQARLSHDRDDNAVCAGENGFLHRSAPIHGPDLHATIPYGDCPYSDGVWLRRRSR